jgi:hypothetical protein
MLTRQDTLKFNEMSLQEASNTNYGLLGLKYRNQPKPQQTEKSEPTTRSREALLAMYSKRHLFAMF